MRNYNIFLFYCILQDDPLNKKQMIRKNKTILKEIAAKDSDDDGELSTLIPVNTRGSSKPKLADIIKKTRDNKTKP